MAFLHDALEAAIHQEMGHGAELKTRTRQLEEWLALRAGFQPGVGDVELALRQMHEAGRIRLYAEGGSDSLRIELPATARRTSLRREQNISIGGNAHVQVGDHNQQAITYGDVLQTLVKKIEHSSGLAPTEKATLLDNLKAVLAHPFVQTIITTGVALGKG